MLTNTIEMLKLARQEKVCIPAFNIYNLETIQAGFQAAKELERPVILAFGEGYLSNVSLDVIYAIVKTLDITHPYPMALHLDHCKSLSTIQKALELGFTSVMYDGSALPFEENCENTKIAVNLARRFEASIEGELGSMNAEDGTDSGESYIFTDPDQAALYVEKTGIDSLAVSVGNAHGVYHGVPHIDLQRLEAIYEKISIPLVLHGSSGIPKEQILAAKKIAIAKMNVNTEIALEGSRAIKELLLEKKESVRLEKLMKSAQDSMKETMKTFLQMGVE